MIMKQFNPRYMAKSYEWEYKLYFHWYFTLRPSTTPLIVLRMQQGWTALKLCQWVVNFTPGPINCQGRGPQYPLNRCLNVPQGKRGHFREKMNFLTLQRFDPQIIRLVVSSLGWPLRRETLVGVIGIKPDLNTLRMGDADLGFHITTVQDGWANLRF
jgi:hypothetical protein